MKPTYTEKDFGPQNADRVREALVGKTLPHAIRNLRDLELSAPPDEKALRKTQHLERDQQIAYFDRVRGCLDQDGRALPHRPGADLIHAIGNENAAGRAANSMRFTSSSSARTGWRATCAMSSGWCTTLCGWLAATSWSPMAGAERGQSLAII